MPQVTTNDATDEGERKAGHEELDRLRSKKFLIEEGSTQRWS